jgi:hypothetical protein
MITGEIFLAVNVAVLLTTIGAVLITLVLDDQLVRQVDQVDSANRTPVVSDDQIAFRRREPREDEGEPQPGLPRGVHPFAYQSHRGTRDDHVDTLGKSPETCTLKCLRGQPKSACLGDLEGLPVKCLRYHGWAHEDTLRAPEALAAGQNLICG